MVFPFISSAQFDESNYIKVSQGTDPENADHQYVITYKNNQNSTYRLKKVYRDSSYTEIISKSFYKDSLQQGPFLIYSKGKMVLQGSYKNGKWDGERLTYLNEKLLQRAYYKEGVRIGTWEEYYAQGVLRSKITFDNTGKVVSDIKY